MTNRLTYHVAKRAVELWDREYVGQPQDPLWKWAVEEARQEIFGSRPPSIEVQECTDAEGRSEINPDA